MTQFDLIHRLELAGWEMNKISKWNSFKMVLLFFGHFQGCGSPIQAKELGILFKKLVNMIQ